MKNYQDKENAAVRGKVGKLSGFVGILSNAVLCIGKLLIGTISGSVSITADAMNNLSDAASQLVALFGCRIAAKEADRHHPFGHARMEYVTSMIVSMIILVIGYELMRDSISKIFNPSPTVFHTLTILILAVSIAVKVWLGLFNRALGKKIDSDTLRATMVDSLSDAAATTAVLLSMIFYRLTNIDIDAYVGIAVAVLIFVAGGRVLNDAKNAILGEAPSAETLDAIRAVVAQYPDALGIHDMMVHNYGPGRTVASLHVEVDGSRNVFDMHDMIDCIEKQLHEDCGILATVHMDPIVVGDAEVDRLHDAVQTLLQVIDPRISMHDFRFVRGTTHSNLIFDVAAPFELELSEKELCDRISLAVRTIDPSYRTVVTVDRA